MSKPKLYPKLNTIFKIYSGYDPDNFLTLEKITNWLHRPVDAAALGVFRILFGTAMLIDIAEERGGSQIDIRFGDERTCHFPLSDYIQALNFPKMGAVYFLMWLGAIGIALGYKFKLSCLLFTVPYWYVFLLEKPAWNNHSYLFGLCGILLLTTNANRFCSVDSHISENMEEVVPYWNYFIIKFQFFILYAYAGLKKFSIEWLSGYAMSDLSYHWLFTPFRFVLSPEMIDLLIIHWFTAFFDLSIPFLMTFQKSRIFATPFMLSFHLMNSRLFSIGMFPWVCLAEVPLFFHCEWPRYLQKLIHSYKSDGKKDDNEDLFGENPEEATDLKSGNLRNRKQIKIRRRLSTNLETSFMAHHTSVGWRDKIRSLIILTYCILQLFLPYSHFITKGYNNWTNGLYGYSWDMMVHSYDTVKTTIKIVDNNNKNVHYLEPFAFTQYDRWTKSADMAVQYAKCIHRNIVTEMNKNRRKSLFSSTNISIYFDIWCSMNGRFQQRVFDPTVDLLTAPWSPFMKTTWSLPLLNELNYMRPKIKYIADNVLSWSNHSDVIFVADFPGMVLENFISSDLNNVTLTVIEGSVTYKSNNQEKHLSTGQSTLPVPGDVHFVTTTSLQPSCYLYTFNNKTMAKQQKAINNTFESFNNTFSLYDECAQRINNYIMFLYHIFNSLMFLVYRVPMPIFIREL